MDATLLDMTDAVRRGINGKLADTRAALGQYMTPAPVASFMASLVRARRRRLRILDPGAGVGSLTVALLDRLLARRRPPDEIAVTCYEIDPRLFHALAETLGVSRHSCQARGVSLTFQLRQEDYIEARATSSQTLFEDDSEQFDCVIMNPPYRKISSNSATRLQLRSMGIEVTNLYAAFMLLAARQLRTGGEFVSISPRSFCNGPYFRMFRREFLQLLDLRRLHVFESRKAAFRDDDVLQENVIVYGSRANGQSGTLEVSASDCGNRVSRRVVPSSHVVQPGDGEAIIHIATSVASDEATETLLGLSCGLDDIGLAVSTGRVVDFRARRYLRTDPVDGTVPLIYSTHFYNGRVAWPNGNKRKAKAIVATDSTASLLVPSGFYVLTKRFSAKEERRRVVAALFDPGEIQAERVGFDNKTNYFHAGGSGIDESVARGLVAYLNSTVVDQYFRRFSGHTQVNAADLRRMPYPTRDQLRRLGRDSANLDDQDRIDAAVNRALQSCR